MPTGGFCSSLQEKMEGKLPVWLWQKGTLTVDWVELLFERTRLLYELTAKKRIVDN